LRAGRRAARRRASGQRGRPHRRRRRLRDRVPHRPRARRGRRGGGSVRRRRRVDRRRRRRSRRPFSTGRDRRTLYSNEKRVPMTVDHLFDRDVANDHPRLERLFEQAKQDFWNESTVIDWSRDFTIPADRRRPLARVLSIIYYGERAALEVSAQLLTMVDDEQAKFALAAQVIEEAKHVSVFRRVLKKLDDIQPVHPLSRRILGDLVATRNAAAKLIGMQLIVENVANHLFHHIAEAIPDPLLKEVLAYVARDEKKHTGIAAIYLPVVLKKLSAFDVPYIKAKQLYWSFCLDRTIFNHRHD